MEPIEIRFTEKMIKEMEKKFGEGMYPNRGELIRDAVRKLIEEKRARR